MINITGCDLHTLIKEAYNLSKPQGLGFMHFDPAPLTDDEILAILMRGTSRCPVNMDYVKGRAVKLNVFINEENQLSIHDSWYDHNDIQLDTLLQRIGIKKTAA